MFDWNDLRHFLAVAREGSESAAARSLGVDQSTVHRRIVALEARLGRELVARHPQGHRLTDFGRLVLPFAESVERAAVAVAELPASQGRGEAGVIRLTCPEPIVARMTQSLLLERFHALHPALKVEFVMRDRYVDLAKGEADVALRSGDTDAAGLIGRKVADSIWAVYASRGYLARHGAPDSIADMAAHPLIGLDESMTGHRLALWLHAVAPDATFAARNGSILGLVSAAKAGLGVAALPTALGDGEPDLVRVLGPVDALTRAWRLLTRPDLRKTRRVAAFFDFCAAERAALRRILTG